VIDAVDDALDAIAALANPALVTNPFLLSGELFEAVDRGVDVRPHLVVVPIEALVQLIECVLNLRAVLLERVDESILRSLARLADLRLDPVAEVGVVKRRKRLLQFVLERVGATDVNPCSSTGNCPAYSRNSSFCVSYPFAPLTPSSSPFGTFDADGLPGIPYSSTCSS